MLWQWRKNGENGEIAGSFHTPSPSPTIGSEATSCSVPEGPGQCYAPFTFGVPQEMTFTAVSQVVYTFYPSAQDLPPSASGRRLGSSVTINPVLEVEDLSTDSFLRNATVTFMPVDPPDPSAAPEPGTAALVLGALLVLLAYGTRIAPAAPPTTTDCATRHASVGLSLTISTSR
jgi:hypothetical protein